MKEGESSIRIKVALFNLDIEGHMTEGEAHVFKRDNAPKNVCNYKRLFWTFLFFINKLVKVGRIRNNLSGM